jgi:hypothetical protein
MAFKHQAGAFLLPMKYSNDIGRPRFHRFDNYVESHLFKKTGDEKGYLFLVFSRTPDTWNSDELLGELDQFLFLNFF